MGKGGQHFPPCLYLPFCLLSGLSGFVIVFLHFPACLLSCFFSPCSLNFSLPDFSPSLFIALPFTLSTISPPLLIQYALAAIALQWIMQYLHFLHSLTLLTYINQTLTCERGGKRRKVSKIEKRERGSKRRSEK